MWSEPCVADVANASCEGPSVSDVAVAGRGRLGENGVPAGAGSDMGDAMGTIDASVVASSQTVPSRYVEVGASVEVVVSGSPKTVDDDQGG